MEPALCLVYTQNSNQKDVLGHLKEDNGPRCGLTCGISMKAFNWGRLSFVHLLWSRESTIWCLGVAGCCGCDSKLVGSTRRIMGQPDKLRKQKHITRRQQGGWMFTTPWKHVLHVRMSDAEQLVPWQLPLKGILIAIPGLAARYDHLDTQQRRGI